MVNMQDIINILPNHIRNILNEIDNTDNLQEIRIKVNKPLIIGVGSREIITRYLATFSDLTTIIQRMSNYSIYAVEEELKQGYITIKGGHRVGICGNCVIEGNKVKTIRNISSLNIRICREVKGCSDSVIKNIVKDDRVQNTIIISPPKCGKTTLIRDISRNLSNGNYGMKLTGKKVCIVDERSEIAACYNGVPQMDVGIRTDVLDNCPKHEGIMMAIRSMSPDVIVCDEIGTYADIESIIMALNSGVSLITTIHGYDVEDLYKRNVFKDILSNNVFNYAVVLSAKRGVGTVECIRSI